MGDAYFREKCLARISGFRDRGKTIVMVSHDTGMIEQLCDRVLWNRSRRNRGSRPPARSDTAISARCVYSERQLAGLSITHVRS